MYVWHLCTYVYAYACEGAMLLLSACCSLTIILNIAQFRSLPLRFPFLFSFACMMACSYKIFPNAIFWPQQEISARQQQICCNNSSSVDAIWPYDLCMRVRMYV